MRILLASSLLFLFSFQSVRAESVWLILTMDLVNRVIIEKIEMKDMEQCEAQGKIYKNSKRIFPRNFRTEKLSRRGFECLKGK